MEVSNLESERQRAPATLPLCLQKLNQLKAEPLPCAKKEQKEISAQFPLLAGQPLLSFVQSEGKKSAPLRVGVLFSGGQAPGGHNVVAGLFDAIRSLHPDSTLIGFLDGPQGVIENRAVEISSERLAPYRNQGGFDLLASSRTKIETEEQLSSALKTLLVQKLDGLVIIGGDDSNTNALVLAEYAKRHGCGTTIVGVPKTIDGDLKNEFVEASFGFDTASKVFASNVGSICRDALSAKKYYFFIKLMGRSASHLALEVALTTHPNLALIAEEIEQKKYSLNQTVAQICDVIEARAALGKNYGVILIPEGLIESIADCKQLIQELNEAAASGKKTEDTLTEASRACFSQFPESVQRQLLLDRDPHGNVKVSQIETDRLLIHLVMQELKKRGKRGSFSAQPHFCGYEGRSCTPSVFDAQYCTALGAAAALLVHTDASGYMATVCDLARPVREWGVRAVPLSLMMQMERRKGALRPVIQKQLVDLTGAPFQRFASQRERWKIEDLYCNPGPIQYFGPDVLVHRLTHTLTLESDNGALS